MEKVYFIGAGPGDPELITIKGQRIVKEADVIIYAGSLVPKEVIDCHKEGAEIYNSASMSLDEVIDVTVKAIKNGKKVARVHTGDPAIYGAHREQMDMLDEYGIEYEVIPGVSSFLASAAALKKEFTLPNVSQTVICTRIEGRTAVPKRESLESLAKHRASMAIFLSVHMIDKVVEKFEIAYPDLRKNLENIRKIVKIEEEKFSNTLDQGIQLVNQEIDNLLANRKNKLDGEISFKLYDTYGFPYELTEEIAEERGVTVLREEFEAKMEEQKEKARSAREVVMEKGQDSFIEEFYDKYGVTKFTGYEKTEDEGKFK